MVRLKTATITIQSVARGTPTTNETNILRNIFQPPTKRDIFPRSDKYPALFHRRYEQQ